MLFLEKYRLMSENNQTMLQPSALRQRSKPELYTMNSPRTFVNSPLARVARLVLGGNARVAMVLGQTVHLSGATRAGFLADPEWVAHEEVHLRQVRDLGLPRFLWQYLVESARVGYYQNRFEVEAREGARLHMLGRANELATRPAAPAGVGKEPGPGPAGR